MTRARNRTRAPLLALSAGVILALAGCSGAGLSRTAPATADPAYSPSAAAVPSGVTPSQTPVAEVPSPTTTLSVATPSPTAAAVQLAGADFIRSDFMDHRLIHLRFDVLTLMRQGRLVELTARITNMEPVPTQSDDDSTPLAWRVDGLGSDDGSTAATFARLGSAYSATTLVDVVAKKRYLVAVDSRGTCLCTPPQPVGASIGPGASLTLNATYAAPPATTTRVTVDVPGIGSFAGVPIS